MGSDDLFHKRKAQAALARVPRARRDQHPRMLIVCEGEKTEPLYLRDLCQSWAIPTAWVKTIPSKGSSPDQVVATAQANAKQAQEEGDAYDAVYCVFDRDRHEKFTDALAQCEKQSKKQTAWHAITSTPCFEFWLLLHFGLSSKAYGCTSDKSVCDQVIVDFKKHAGFEQYKKKQPNVWALLEGKTNAAIRHAKTLRQQQERTDQHPQRTANPWTNVDVLVERLREISPQTSQSTTKK